jgi:hypothetical protein
MARRLGKPISPSHASSADAPHEEPQMAWHPAEWLLEAPRLPAHWQTYRPTVDELVVAIPQVAHRLDEVDQWAVGLRPLRVLLVRVWEAFWPATMLRRHDADPAVPQRQTGDAKGVDQRWWA